MAPRDAQRSLGHRGTTKSGVQWVHRRGRSADTERHSDITGASKTGDTGHAQRASPNKRPQACQTRAFTETTVSLDSRVGQAGK